MFIGKLPDAGAEARGDRRGADRIEAVAVDEGFGAGHAEDSWFGVTSLRLRGNAPNLEDAHGGRGGVECVDGFTMLVEASGDTERGVQRKPK